MVKKAEVLMLMLGLIGTIDQPPMANCVHWHGHLLMKERGWSHLEGITL